MISAFAGLVRLIRRLKLNAVVAVQVNSTFRVAALLQIAGIEVHILTLHLKDAGLFILVFDEGGAVDVHRRDE